jgi:hypothetical protein
MRKRELRELALLVIDCCLTCMYLLHDLVAKETGITSLKHPVTTESDLCRAMLSASAYMCSKLLWTFVGVYL